MFFPPYIKSILLTIRIHARISNHKSEVYITHTVLNPFVFQRFTEYLLSDVVFSWMGGIFLVCFKRFMKNLINIWMLFAILDTISNIQILILFQMRNESRTFSAVLERSKDSISRS